MSEAPVTPSLKISEITDSQYANDGFGDFTKAGDASSNSLVKVSEQDDEVNKSQSDSHARNIPLIVSPWDQFDSNSPFVTDKQIQTV